MDGRIKVGEFYLEIPTDALIASNQPAKNTTEMSDLPETMAEQPYIYRPNDPFQSSIDQAHAITQIGSHHKPWVRKTWFFLFVVLPLLTAELSALSSVLTARDIPLWQSILLPNLLVSPMWIIYCLTWRKRMK